MLAPDFWDDNDAAQKTISELNALKGLVETMGKLDAQYEDLQVMLELIIEEGDDSMIQDVYDSTQALKKEFESFELELLLSDQYDKNNAILELHPGAGGTESQDWASMLLRMYTRWGNPRASRWRRWITCQGMKRGLKALRS